MPCFEHYYDQAKKTGLDDDEINQATDFAAQVKKGSHVTMRGSIKAIMGGQGKYAGGRQEDGACGGSASASCCG